MKEQRTTHTWRTKRRCLSDDILIAFHQACDQDDIEVARSLLKVLEFMMWRPATAPNDKERRAWGSLIAAYERLCEIMHAELL
jgi:hypothetical protein